MPSFHFVRLLLGTSFVLLLPLQVVLPDPPPAPTDAEVHNRIKPLEQNKDEQARLEALEWVQKHSGSKYSCLAIPALERIIRGDPVSKVREKAIFTLFDVAEKQKLPCPLALVQSIFDGEVVDRQTPMALTLMFKEFAPGTVELAFRAAGSEETDIRDYGLNLLSITAPRNEKALAVIEAAKNDRSYMIRCNCRCYKFKADDNLGEFLSWLIRVQEDKAVLEPIPKDEKMQKMDQGFRSLNLFASASLIRDWCEKRPDDMAAALLQLLDHKSPLVRRGAARMIRVTTVKTALSERKLGEEGYAKEISYLYPEFDSEWIKPGSPPQPRFEKSKVAFCLEKGKVKERLKKLSDKDPDRAVRKAAQLALDHLALLQDKP